MADEPLPEGNRNVPPSRTRIALGQGDPGPRGTVMVHIEGPSERDLIVGALERNDFETIVPTDDVEVLLAMHEMHTGTLITDDFQLIKNVSSPKSRWKVLALCLNHESTIEYANQCGADAVMLKPLPEDGEAIIEWFK